MKSNYPVVTVACLLLMILTGCATQGPKLRERPMAETQLIPPLPTDLQARCPLVVPREGKDARLELFRALVVNEQCAALKADVAGFYNAVRVAQIGDAMP